MRSLEADWNVTGIYEGQYERRIMDGPVIDVDDGDGNRYVVAARMRPDPIHVSTRAHSHWANKNQISQVCFGRKYRTTLREGN